PVERRDSRRICAPAQGAGTPFTTIGEGADGVRFDPLCARGPCVLWRRKKFRTENRCRSPQTPPPAPAATAPSGPRLSADQAIEAVKSWTSASVMQPCTQFDVDTDPMKGEATLAKCQPIGGRPGAPHGCKKMPVQMLPGWRAEFIASSATWKVSL